VSFEGEEWTTYNTSNSGLTVNEVRAVAIDQSDTKWIGTLQGGLSVYNGSTWSTYNTSNSGLPGNYVTSIVIDSDGAKWIGTYGGGLAKFSGTEWTNYSISNSDLSANYINTLAIDENGTKWIGTKTKGLASFNENGNPAHIKDNDSASERINIFPNPANNKLNIDLPDNVSVTSIDILNLQGCLLKIQTSANINSAIDVSHLPNGVYLLRITTEKGVLVKKLLKQ
jgi:ligand-binding sensor domain-containing protein